MIWAAAAAAVLVGTASLASLLCYLPLLALAESFPAGQLAARARVWRAGLLLPPLAGAVAVGYAVTRHATHPLFSPHAGRLRPHLCFRALLEGPEGAWRAHLLAGFCLLLVVVGFAALAASLVRSGREGRLARKGAALLPAPAPGVELRRRERGGLASSRGLGALVVCGPALERLFPGSPGQAIVMHEVCHARQRDNLWGALSGSALLLQAFSPLAWVCYRNWLLTRELSCDLYAARATSPAATQAALEQARELTEAVEEAYPLTALGQPVRGYVDLRLRRLQALAAAEPSPEGKASPALVLGGVGLLALSLVGVAALPQLPDSLHCALESLLRALGG